MEKTTTKVDLVINKLSQTKYDELSAAGQIDPNQLYFTTDTTLDGGNQPIRNVAEPTLSSDAATKNYVDQNAFKESNIVGQIHFSNVLISGRFFPLETVVKSSYLDSNRKYNWELVFANYSTIARTCWIKSSKASESTNVAVAAGTTTVPLVVIVQDPDGPYAYDDIPSMSFNNGDANKCVTLRLYDAGPA